jgi:hypothetical protein
MKHFLRLNLAVALALSCTFLLLHRAAGADEEYSFKVTNSTDSKITRLLASEDGKEYGNFELSREGIAPGKTVKLTWDKSTNNRGCNWYLKAVFADGSESEAKKFDFCEADLEVEF